MGFLEYVYATGLLDKSDIRSLRGRLKTTDYMIVVFVIIGLLLLIFAHWKVTLWYTIISSFIIAMYGLVTES